MYCFKVKNVNSDVFVLNFNDEFMKYIKKSDLNKLKHNIESYLQQISYTYTHVTFLEESDGTLTYNLDVKKIHLAELINLFLLGTDKKKIEMPPNLSLSKETNRPVFYAYRSVEGFIKYWSMSDSVEKKYALYQQLSEDLIEIPYVDKPDDYMFRFDKVAFHPNHGTNHGLRLTKYFNHYLHAIKLLGKEESKKLVTMSVEEERCLELALFLFRSGRTNELGWSGDPSYSPRSAFIFTKIATELGFNINLVKAIAGCFDYKRNFTDNSAEASLAATDRQKTSLYQTLFKLCHQSDLIRCNTNYAEIANTIIEELALLLALDTESVEQFVFECLVLAARCCKDTGAPVFVSELHQASGTTLHENQLRTVNAVHDIPLVCVNLDHICANTIESDQIVPNTDECELNANILFPTPRPSHFFSQTAQAEIVPDNSEKEWGNIFYNGFK